MDMTEPITPQPTVPPPPVYGPPRYNTMAIVALVLALLTSVGGIVCGHIALSQIRRTGEPGHGLALAATVIGYVFTGLTVVWFVLIAIVLIGWGASAGPLPA